MGEGRITKARTQAARLGLAVLVTLLGTTVTLADGTETLGEPVDLTLAAGTGIATGGTGLVTQPGTIEIDVPEDATVAQVLLYWAGELRDVDDDTIMVGGDEVTGTLIGGPTFFYNYAGDVFVSAYRADVTDLGLILPGLNTLSVEGLDYDDSNDGAAVVVIYQQGEAQADIQLRDGVDLAFFKFPDPRENCVPQSFSFDPADEARIATLALFAGSIEPGRPNELIVTVDDVATTYTDLFGSFDGPDWDTLNMDVELPAGATTLTVQPVSPESNDPLAASLAWIGAALSVPIPADDDDELYQGCPPRYWMQCRHVDEWTNYHPNDSFNEIFGTDIRCDPTLMRMLWRSRGPCRGLNRHAVAALLNASHPDVNYMYTADEVIAMVQEAHDTGTCRDVKRLLRAQNRADCPLCDRGHHGYGRWLRWMFRWQQWLCSCRNHNNDMADD